MDNISDDKTLLNFIASKTYLEALEFLQGNHTFSQDGLDQSLISACRNGHKYLIQALVRHGANVQYKDIHEDTPLLICAGNGFIDIVRYLLTQKACINDVNSAGDTALIRSVCSSGSTDLTKLLLEQDGIDINHQNREGSTALMKAIEAMDIDTIKVLLEKSHDVEQKSHFEIKMDSPNTILDPTLHWSRKTVHKLAKNHRLTNIFKLLKASADTRMSPLMLAVKECDKKSVINFLDCEFVFTSYLKQSMDESFTEMFRNLEIKITNCYSDDQIEIMKKLMKWCVDNNKCELSLIVVLSEKHRETDFVVKFVWLLLKCGASVNERDDEDKTPLMLAAMREGNGVIIQTLLDDGADFHAHDRYGDTALMYAVRVGCSQNVLFLLEFAKKKKLCLNGQNHKGSTALMLSIKIGSKVQLIQMLINYGANVNITDVNGNTALLMVLTNYSSFSRSLVTDLIKAGSDVNCQNSIGFSPLMIAASKLLADVITVLLDSGADVNAVSKWDNRTTAMGILLKEFDFKENAMHCLRVLLDNGANSSSENQVILHKMIIKGEIDVIPKLIQGGLGPENVKTSLLEYTKLNLVYSDCSVLPTVSPLYVALLVRNVPLAHYFVGNLFLTKSDVSYLMFKKNLQFPAKLLSMACFDFLDETSSQPLSLFQLAFVTVSSAVGTFPGRENRIDRLPLPKIMKEKLLFKSQEVELDILAAATAAAAVARLRSWFQSNMTAYMNSGHYDINSWFLFPTVNFDLHFGYWCKPDLLTWPIQTAEKRRPKSGISTRSRSLPCHLLPKKTRSFDKSISNRSRPKHSTTNKTFINQ